MRARNAAYVVVTVAIVGSVYPLSVLMRPRNDEWAAFGVIMWFVWGGIAMIIAAVVEAAYSALTHWEPWRSYAVVALFLIIALGGFSGGFPSHPSAGMVLLFIMVSVAIGVALLFVLRQLCAVFEGLGIYGTPYVPIGLIRRSTEPTIEG